MCPDVAPADVHYVLLYTAVRRQTAVTAYFSNNYLLLFAFERQYLCTV